MQTKLIGLRKYNDKTQRDMADLLGVDVRTYINKEKGITQFKMGEMFKISQYFQKPIEEIFLPTNFMNYEVGKRAR